MNAASCGQRTPGERSVWDRIEDTRSMVVIAHSGFLGKGNKPAVIPLVPRAAGTIDLVIGERAEGPILRRHDGHRLDRRTARRWVRAIGKRVGLGVVYPHMFGRGSCGRPRYALGMCRSPPATPTRGPRRSTTEGGRTSTVVLPMLWWRLWLADKVHPQSAGSRTCSRPLAP